MFVSGFGALGFTTGMVTCPLLIVTGVLTQPIISQCTHAQINLSLNSFSIFFPYECVGVMRRLT